MANIDTINCLLSHKCDEEAHRVGERLKISLRAFEIFLQIDPFTVGDNAGIRMQTFDIEAVLFLYSPESFASEWVQLELRSAERQGIPMFTAHVRGEIAHEWKERSYWHIPEKNESEFLSGIESLAGAIWSRVRFKRKLDGLKPDGYYLETIAAARDIATQGERTEIAEFVSNLAKKYVLLDDPSTHYWLALAIGRADTAEAEEWIERLPRPVHPLEEEGIRQAREMLHRKHGRARFPRKDRVS